jgi:hypothetical protein
MTLPLWALSARRYDAEICLFRCFNGAGNHLNVAQYLASTIYLDHQRDDVKYRLARRRYKENRDAAPLFDSPQYRRCKLPRRQSQCSGNQQMSRFWSRTLT